MLACKTQQCPCMNAGRHCDDFQCCRCTKVPSPRLEVDDQTTYREKGGIRKAARREMTAAVIQRSAPVSLEDAQNSRQKWQWRQWRGRRRRWWNRGGCRGSTRVRTHRGGLEDQGGQRKLDVLQQWISPQWRVQGQPGMAVPMENSEGDARSSIRRSKQAFWIS